MATQTFEFPFATGKTLVGKIFALNADTELASVSCTEKTNSKGIYTVNYSSLSGAYRFLAFSGSDPVYTDVFDVTDITATFNGRGETKVASSEDVQAVITHGDANWSSTPDYTPLYTHGDANWSTADTAAVISHGDANWTSAGAGAGSIECILEIRNGEGVIEGATIWIMNDDEDTLVQGDRTTDANGNVTFWLDAGVYKVYGQHVDINKVNPLYTITVSASAIVVS